jgi:hypothetical protein
MNRDNARRLISELDPKALVVDVGGGALPFPRADYVIDALPFEKQGALGRLDVALEPRYKRETWCQVDLCERRPWPFPDKFFDYSVCSHLLEDVRDPIWICSELCRVSKAGYIEVPSRVQEQSLGVEHPSYAGYHHHRWLVTSNGDGLTFRHKPHVLHAIRDAIVASVGVSRAINEKYTILPFEWSERFEFREVLEFDETAVVNELCAFAQKARQLPELIVPVSRSYMKQFKRFLYYRRLKKGRR